MKLTFLQMPVCYAYFASYAQVYLFNVFAKSAQENLSAREKQALKNAMTEIKTLLKLRGVA